MNLEYVGKLSTYYETGFEGIALILEVEDERFNIPNPNPQEGRPQFFRSLEGAIFLRKEDVLEIETPDGIRKFTLGNKILAHKHNYRFGVAYPLEINSLEDLSDYIFFFKNEYKAKVIRKVNSLAFYGGTFDPIHNGHKEIISKLHYMCDLVYVLPSNNWTKSNFTFPIQERIRAVEAVCNNFLNVQVLDWSLSEDTSSTLNMYKKIEHETGVKAQIVIGSDNLEKITHWKHFEELNKCSFLVFTRNDLPKEIPIKNYKIINFSNNISSTAIRKEKLINNIPQEALDHLNLDLLNKKIDF